MSKHKPLIRQVWVTLQEQQFGDRHRFITGIHLSNHTNEYRADMDVVGAISLDCWVVQNPGFFTRLRWLIFGVKP